MLTARSAMGGPMDGQNGDRDDDRKDDGQHGDDEPGGPFRGLGRRLGDAHGVDESIRDE
jgi:hypothetical protein